MLISEVYEGLKNQGHCFDAMERQVQGLLDTNTVNVKNTECLKLADNRLSYLTNQHGIFIALMEIVIDMKVTNVYSLFDIECQLREEALKDT